MTVCGRFLPSLTYSAHWIRDPALRRAIDEEQTVLESFAPFRKDGG